MVCRARRGVRAPPEMLVGKALTRAESLGKNILLVFEDLGVRVHMMMYGSMRVLRRGDDLGRPERQVRLLLDFGEKVLVFFNAPVIELDGAEVLRRKILGSLGPDPLGDTWDEEEVLRRMKERGDEKVGVLLLDQRVVAGVGNILRNEILFRAGISPERRISELREDELRLLVKTIKEVCELFADSLVRRGSVKSLFVVYNNYRGFCPRCGSKIKFFRQEPIGRKTFACPVCQR